MANKLYKLSYLSEMIEKFATNMLMSAVEQSPSGIEHSQSESTGQRVEGMVCFFHLLLYFLSCPCNCMLQPAVGDLVWSTVSFFLSTWSPFFGNCHKQYSSNSISIG